jgi:WD40 repeat protein
MPSFKASRSGVLKIRQAIDARGWRPDDERWLIEVSRLLEPNGNWQAGGPYADGCSQQTWERFVTGKKAIRDRSFTAFCTVLGLDPEEVRNSLREDWGGAPEVPALYGREKELETLEQWIVKDRCKLVTILGIAGVGKSWLVKGGIGKTDLSLELARHIQGNFEYLIWRSLLSAPSLETILGGVIEFLSDGQTTTSAETTEGKVNQLLQYLNRYRCLLILDNVESILKGGTGAGQYREGFEGYGDLFRRIGEAAHQSCLLLTSREKPQDITAMERVQPVRSLRLAGLDQQAGQRIFDDISRAQGTNFYGSDEDWGAIIHFYNGNPLALEVVARYILEWLGGNIAEFVQQHLSAFDEIRALLDWHFNRLSNAEQEVMYWLAINREPVSVSELKDDIVLPLAKKQILDTLGNLERQLPIEKSGDRFTLQPVLIEYMIDRLIKQVCNEIETKEIQLFNSHALMKASAQDYVRDSQVRLILKVIIEQLITKLGLKGESCLEYQLTQILYILRERYQQRPGYAGGNLLNLLCQLGTDISSYDFSCLTIWQAYLQGISLDRVNFAYCNFARTIFTQAFGGVHSIAFSPDGELVAVGDSNGDIRLFQTKNEQQQSILRGHSKSLWVSSVAFSPNGQMLASCSFDRTVKLWDVHSGECLRTFEGHTNWLWTVAFSSDGKTVASGGDDQTARLWNIATGESKILKDHQGWVWSVTFSPDDQFLATGSYDKTIRLWNVSTGKCLKILEGHENSVWSLAFSPDGQILASGSLDYTVKFWNVSSGECFNTLRGHSKEVRSIAFSADGQILASGSFDQTIRLWDACTGEHLKTLKGHTNGIRTLAFNTVNNTLASGDNYQVLKLWNINTGECFKTLQGHSNWMWTLAFSPDGKTLASGSLDQVVRIWDISCSEVRNDRTHEISVLRGHTNWVWSVAFSPDGKIIASSSDDETIRLWDVSTGQCFRTLRGHKNGGVWSITFSPNGQTLASGGQDGTVRLWDIHTGEELFPEGISAHQNWIWAVVFHPGGQMLASCSDDQTIKFWDVNTGQCLMNMQKNTGRVMSIAFSPDGQTLISGNDDGEVKLWDIQTGNLIKTFQEHRGWVLSVAFNPSEQMIASASTDETIRLWSNYDGECIKVLQRHSNWVRSVAFAPNGQTLASCGTDGTIQLWDVQTGDSFLTLQPKRPYEGVNITGATGLTNAQRETLIALGAVEITDGVNSF